MSAAISTPPNAASGVIVTGTDTDIGKTVLSAALVSALDADYWKPIQSGLDGPTDSQTVATLAPHRRGHIHPEAYRLTTPCSPHRSAELDSVEIEPARVATPPTTANKLIIEGAGGLLVPVTRSLLLADLFAAWQRPVVLCARTSLGTINHTLLSIEALWARQLPILGIAFIGDGNADTERTICEMGQTRRLGRLPRLADLTADNLKRAFMDNFNRSDFA